MQKSYENIYELICLEIRPEPAIQANRLLQKRNSFPLEITLSNKNENKNNTADKK